MIKTNPIPRFSRAPHLLLMLLAAGVLAACSTTLPAQSRSGSNSALSAELGPQEAPTYADLVTFSLNSDLVAIVTVDDQAVFPPERAPDVPANRVRLYLETLTQNLLASDAGVGESLIFVTDIAREADGDAPDLEERSYIIFAKQIAARPGEVQLISSRAMLPAGPIIEERVRRVLRQLAAAEPIPEVTGVRDVISVPGNLVGESETQMFIETRSGAPVSLSVVRRPGLPPHWGISLGEIVDSSARPPEPESLSWYGFACFLPDQLPDSAFLQSDRQSRERARADYAFVLSELGRCERRYS
ncbi:hypothetical protein [Erythrobacter alti]|uniref:hypothetical protein n=1 Tax=Erythrobacter alti TaxID=1896145 RepID=UPI0030F43389